MVPEVNVTSPVPAGMATRMPALASGAVRCIASSRVPGRLPPRENPRRLPRRGSSVSSSVAPVASIACRHCASVKKAGSGSSTAPLRPTAAAETSQSMPLSAISATTDPPRSASRPAADAVHCSKRSRSTRTAPSYSIPAMLNRAAGRPPAAHWPRGRPGCADRAGSSRPSGLRPPGRGAGRLHRYRPAEPPAA